MTVISVLVCTRRGRVIVSRQYFPISKAKLEGLIISFPKLIDKNQQHTYVETEDYRYLYTLLGDSLYLILLTHRKSNMIQDMTLLRSLFELTQSTLQNVLTEESALQRGFDLLFSYDECISTLGHPEMLSLDQVHTILKMESHEENIQDMIVEGQIIEARKKADRAAKRIKKSLRANDGRYTTGIASTTAPGLVPSIGRNTPYGRVGDTDDEDAAERSGRESPKRRPGRRTGLVLGARPKASGAASEGSGRKKRSRVFRQQGLLAEMGIAAEDDDDEGEGTAVPSSERSKKPPSAIADEKPVSVALVESINSSIDNQAEEISIVIKGQLDITVRDPEFANVRVLLDKSMQKDYRFQSHPKTDRTAFQRHRVVTLKKGVKGFRVGPTPLTVLTWKLDPSHRSDDTVLPVSVTCWPSESSSGMSVALEYAVQQAHVTIFDLALRVPLPDDGALNIDSLDAGTYNIRQAPRGGRYLVWSIPMLEGKTRGSIEFSIDGGNEDSFFPIDLKFKSSTALSGARVTGVVTAAGEEVPYSSTYQCKVEKYALLSI